MAIDADIRAALERLQEANRQLAEQVSEANRERVCIETRAAQIIYEDVMSWAGRVDEETKTKLLDAVEESKRLLARARDDEEGRQIYQAVCERLERLRDFDPTPPAKLLGE